jgi:hypothetical protein
MGRRHFIQMAPVTICERRNLFFDELHLSLFVGATTFRIMTLSKTGLFVTLSINDTLDAIMLIDVMLSVKIYELFC